MSEVSAQSEILIIGAGASGAVAARHFAAAGRKVLCLEQGQWPDESKFVGRRPDWEVAAEPRWNPSPNARLAESDYPIDTSECPLIPMMFNGVGGSTITWSALWHRFTPSDFRVRSLDGVASDWPLTYDELAPFYDRVEADLGVSGLDGDPAYPSHAPYPLPPFPIGRAGAKFARAMHSLDWHWWPGSNAIPTRPYRGRNACVRRNTCMLGCADGAKASTHLTHWPEAIENGAQLVTGARVKEITVNDAGLATGAVYVDRSGKLQRVSAGIVILCANGIGTPRLLLLSQSKRFPSGLANSSGLVGRGLMLHPTGSVAGIADEPLQGWMGPQGQIAYSMQFYNTDAARGFVRGSKWSLLSHGGPMSFAMSMGYGQKLHEAMAASFGRMMTLLVFGEDLPEDENRVVLSNELTDSDDLPAPKIIYRVGANTRKLLEFNIERAAQALAAAGVSNIATEAVNPFLGGAHLLGTARMGGDPERSVVDKWGRCHDVPNLYIFDGSVFATSAAVNPTATICAVALRNAEHVLSERRNQKVAA
jgi:choline dehydrogenase-like flavoprotein